MRSVEISPFCCKTFKAFNESTPPCYILFKCDIEGIGNFFNKSSYAWGDVCLKCNAKRIIEAENGGLPVGFQSSVCFNSSSKTC